MSTTLHTTDAAIANRPSTQNLNAPLPRDKVFPNGYIEWDIEQGYVMLDGHLSEHEAAKRIDEISRATQDNRSPITLLPGSAVREWGIVLPHHNRCDLLAAASIDEDEDLTGLDDLCACDIADWQYKAVDPAPPGVLAVTWVCTYSPEWDDVEDRLTWLRNSNWWFDNDVPILFPAPCGTLLLPGMPDGYVHPPNHTAQ